VLVVEGEEDFDMEDSPELLLDRNLSSGSSQPSLQLLRRPSRVGLLESLEALKAMQAKRPYRPIKLNVTIN
jgi:hypothetical protein